MLVSKATTGLFRNVVWKAENVVSLRIIRYTQNTSQTNQLYFVHKRYKKTSSEEKKRCEDKPKKSRTLAKLATVAVIGTTVAVIAAKHDDDFRDWSKEHLPVLDSLVKIIYQEEDTYLETLKKAHKELTDWIKNALYDLFKRSGQSRPDITSSGPLVNLPPLEPCDDSKKLYNQESKPVEVPKEHKDLKDLEDKLVKTAQDTIQSLASTGCAVRDHAKLIELLDQIINTDNPKIWSRIKKLKMDADKGWEKSNDNLTKFNALVKQLQSKLNDAPNVSDDVKAKAQNNMNTVKDDVKDALNQFNKTKEDNVLAKRIWDKVKQARLHFSEELETLFPNIWLNDQKLKIPADQLDPFTANVLDEMDQMGQELSKNKTMTEGQLNTALDKYKDKGPEAINDIADVLVPYKVSKEKKKQQAELQKSILAHKAKCEKNSKAMLKQTKEVYADLTAEALKLKEKEVERKMQQKLEERLAQARAEHKMEIAKMVGRMQGANEAISKRGEKDKSQQDQQQFWSAAQNFMAAVKPIGADAKSQEPKPLKNEIANLDKVKPKGDELVDAVLGSIPPEAAEKGVPSEKSLREKFMKVMSCARGWAGVPPGEITLLQLFLARLQSALYLNVAIPEAELNNEPAIDLEKLNNYDILHRAKYYVDRGEFDQAIRYLNLLKGPSSKVASDWTKDALVYLETRQAAEVLLAHATAAGMS